MKKTASKITLVIATVLLAESLISLPSLQRVLADDVSGGVYYSHDFQTDGVAPGQWGVVSFNDSSEVKVAGGVLSVNNVSATYTDSDKRDDATEITLPTVYSDNYALEFEMTRIESAANASISIKYAIQEDGAGYEFRIPMCQQDAMHPFWYTDNTAMEYRKVLPGGSVKGNVNNYRFWNLNFYESEFFRATTYHFAFLRYEGRNRLFINGQEYLKHDDNNKIYTDDETGSAERYVGGDLILRFNRAIQAEIDNLSVKTPAQYFTERTQKLGDTATWENQTLLDNAVEIKYLYDLGKEILSTRQLAELEAYQTVKGLWDRYSTIVAPVITLSQALPNSTSAGTEIDLASNVSAKDYLGRALAVEITVKYGDKYLLVKNGKASFNEKGSYVVKYTAYDRNGMSATLERTISVV